MENIHDDQFRQFSPPLPPSFHPLVTVTGACFPFLCGGSWLGCQDLFYLSNHEAQLSEKTDINNFRVLEAKINTCTLHDKIKHNHAL